MFIGPDHCHGYSFAFSEQSMLVGNILSDPSPREAGVRFATHIDKRIRAAQMSVVRAEALSMALNPAFSLSLATKNSRCNKQSPVCLSKVRARRTDRYNPC
jgi:hypothetical protein